MTKNAILVVPKEKLTEYIQCHKPIIVFSPSTMIRVFFGIRPMTVHEINILLIIITPNIIFNQN